MPTLTLDDTEIHYECTGAGPALPLIHGLGSSGAAVAIEMALLRPRQVRRLIVCNTLASYRTEHDYTPLAEKRVDLRHFPQAQLVVVAGSRHGTPFDAVARFNCIVLEYLHSDGVDATAPPAGAAVRT